MTVPLTSPKKKTEFCSFDQPITTLVKDGLTWSNRICDQIRPDDASNFRINKLCIWVKNIHYCWSGEPESVLIIAQNCALPVKHVAYGKEIHF